MDISSVVNVLVRFSHVWPYLDTPSIFRKFLKELLDKVENFRRSLLWLHNKALVSQ